MATAVAMAAEEFVARAKPSIPTHPTWAQLHLSRNWYSSPIMHRTIEYRATKRLYNTGLYNTGLYNTRLPNFPPAHLGGFIIAGPAI